MSNKMKIFFFLQIIERRLEKAEADCEQHELEAGDKRRDKLPLSERIDKPKMR